MDESDEGWQGIDKGLTRYIDSWGVFPRATNVCAYIPYVFGDRWTGPPWLLLVAGGHRWLPSLPLAAVGCHWLPMATASTVGYHRSPPVTVGHHRSPLVTIGHHWLPSVHLGQIMTTRARVPLLKAPLAPRQSVAVLSRPLSCSPLQISHIVQSPGSKYTMRE